MKFERDDALLKYALELSEDTDRFIMFHCADGDVVTRSIFLRLHSSLISCLVNSVPSSPGARCEYSIMLPDVPRAHILHIIELITEGVSDVCAETVEVVNLTWGVINTSKLLGINICRDEGKIPIWKPREREENNFSSKETRQPGNKLNKVNDSEHNKEEEVSMSKKSMEFKLTKSQMKIEDEGNHVQDIILGSKESSNVGPIRTANTYTNSLSVRSDNNNTSRYHPYSLEGNFLHFNHPNFGRGMGISRWPGGLLGPGPSTGFGNYPRGGFGWFMDRPYWN